MTVGSQITFSGLASGLDSRAIIDALLEVERIPILRAQSRQQELRDRSSAYDRLGTALESLQSSLREIDTAGELSSFSVTTSVEDILTVDAGTDAQAGNYRVEVQQLARALTLGSSTVADRSAFVGTGELSFTVDGTTTRVDLGGAVTLDELATRINDSDAGVRASVIDTGSGFRLALSADETGTSGAFTLDATGFSPVLGGFDIESETLQAAQDAIVVIDGITVTRGNNQISDAIAGLTLDLRDARPGTTVAVGVSVDREGLRGKVESFIDAYNGLASQINNQGLLDDEGNPTGSLFGDSGLRTIEGSLRRVLQSSSGGGGVFDTLFSIGVRTNEGGTLSLDTSRFEDAVEADLDSVISLFTDESNGFAKRLDEAIDELTDSQDGVIKLRRDGFDERIRSLDRQVERLEDRLVRYEERLINQYASLESLLAGLNAQGSALTSLGGNGS